MARYQCVPKRPPASTEMVHTEDWMDKSDATTRASQSNSQEYFQLLEHLYIAQFHEPKRSRSQGKKRPAPQRRPSDTSGVHKQPSAKAISLSQRRGSTISLQALELTPLDLNDVQSGTNLHVDKVSSPTCSDEDSTSDPAAESRISSGQNSPSEFDPASLDPAWVSWFKSTLLEELSV